MSSKLYCKLVRDKIPEIISNEGKVVTVYGANLEEKITLLKSKMMEEILEYAQSDNVEELVDILQVLYSLGEAQFGLTPKDLEQLMEKKSMERGAFDEGYVLISVRDKNVR